MTPIDNVRLRTAALLLCGVLLFSLAGARGQAPSLPQGLEEDKEEEKETEDEGGPSLPAGLGGEKDEGTSDGQGPALPSGLGEEEEKEEQPAEPEPGYELPFEFSGFWEARYGVRTRDAPARDSVLEETRLRLEAQHYWQDIGTTGQFKADLLYDPVAHNYDVELNDGRSAIDLREANVSFSPVSFADVRLGRQVLTWGTGDFVFLNDLFPKDYRSFFAGRDVEYLKAPSDAAKASFYTDLVNLDVVYTPHFDNDRFLDGRRFLYWSDRQGRQTMRETDPETPSSWFEEDEIALRAHRMVGGYELAGYFYDGFWKSPAGFNPRSGQPTFPDLRVYGASARGRLGTGIANAEVAYYDSTDDSSGTDPFVNNSEMRVLVGYDQELAAFFPSVKNFTVGGQYYLEHMLDHGRYEASLPRGFRARDENRHVVTLRLTKLYWNQNLELSLFTFYSWSDDDAYLRPRVQYDVTDNWRVEAGGNLFVGDERHTFFGQFEKNSNVYGAVRYSF